MTTHQLVIPDRRLCFELGAVAYLQSAGAAAGEEVRNLLPGQVLLLLEVHEELVVFGRKLELRPTRARRGSGHSLLANDAGRAMLMLMLMVRR